MGELPRAGADPDLDVLVEELQALAPGAHEARVTTLEAVLAKAQVELAQAKRQLELATAAPDERRDWAGGLPADVLMKVAGKVVAQTEARWAAQLKVDHPNWPEKHIQEEMAKRKREGKGLFVFARVCKEWRKVQLKVGGGLRTQADPDVILPGSVALAKWALAEGCPRENEDGFTMAHAAAWYGHFELVQWLCGEGGFAMDMGVMEHAARSGNPELVRWLCREKGFAMDKGVMKWAASSGNLELVQWLRGEGCRWDHWTCQHAVHFGHVEILRWARANGCSWDPWIRDRAAAELGYTDDLGNLVDDFGNPL